ncbi:DUF6292 family protein [Rhodococcus sp. NPDC058521]|uniref:DUF6292 family protein n=1 Tax=Rhodococcus sp. NPDC058521 TaxID=3346536 RepID=UPI0036545970
MTQTLTEGPGGVQGFDGYIRTVVRELGVPIENWCCSTDPPMEAIVQIEGMLPGHPGRDVALVWGEKLGWALAVETRSGEDMIIVRELGGEPMPAPSVVRAFANLVELPRRA